MTYFQKLVGRIRKIRGHRCCIALSRIMESAPSDAVAELWQRFLTSRYLAHDVAALAAKDKMLYGDGGDVKPRLPELRQDLQQEAYRRLLPGYVRNYIENAAPLLGIEIDGDMNARFTFKSARGGAVDPLLHELEIYPASQRAYLSVIRPSPAEKNCVTWLHPGERVFERFRAMVNEHLQNQARRGAVFIDPTAEKPYLFHLALVNLVRQADSELPDLAREEMLGCQLVGIKQHEGAKITRCPVEYLLLLKGGQGLPSVAQRLTLAAERLKEQASAYIAESIACSMATERRQALLGTLPEREEFIRRGFAYREAELATARAKQSQKARSGHAAAAKMLGGIKDQQRSLTERRAMAVATLRREPDLIAPGDVTFLAHALVVPSADSDDIKQHDAEVEQIAMDFARAYEEAAGAVVKDVHTPELARTAGLTDNPGVDLLAIVGAAGRAADSAKAIEVKGRAGTGDVEASANEWARAANLRNGYWLYVVYDCATPRRVWCACAIRSEVYWPRPREVCWLGRRQLSARPRKRRNNDGNCSTHQASRVG